MTGSSPSTSPEAASVRRQGRLERAVRVLPANQVVRYLIVGVGNTVFGYACYAFFVAIYSRMLPARYLPFTVDLASITTTPIGVTVSFLTYKFFVFRTQGNYLREWLRCFAVYGSATIPGLFILPVITRVLQSVASLEHLAGYLAGAIVMGGTTIYTYLAHKNFSFSNKTRRTSKTAAAEHPTT